MALQSYTAKAEALELVYASILEDETQNYTVNGVTVSRHNIEVLDKLLNFYRLMAHRESYGIQSRIQLRK
jgi:hypothetical protein